MNSPFNLSSKKLIILFSGLSGVILIAFLLEVILFAGSETGVLISNILTPAASIIVLCVSFFAAFATIHISKRSALAWGFFALAQFSSVIADATWSILETKLGTPPFPSLADGFFLAYYPLFFTGVFILPGRHYSSQEWMKKGLDLAIIVIASFLTFWNFLIGPTINTMQEDSIIAQLLGAAYPTGDLLILWALLVVLYNRSNLRVNKPILLLGLSTLVLVITDCIYSYQSLMETYISGGLLDIGWLVAYFLGGLAGIYQILYAGSFDQKQRDLDRRSYDFLDRFAAHLPYFSLIGAYVLLVISHQGELVMPFWSISIAVGALIGLVLIRQITTIQENRHLLDQRDLMIQKTQAQAEKLAEYNVSLKEEIENRQRAEERLSYDALHDGLTNLPNRALFLDRLGQAIEFTRRRTDHTFSILFIDLDYFKIVNDSLGHSIGDKLLILLGHRLRNCLRSSDTIARLGGDEFVILLENSGTDDNVLRVAERIQASICSPYQINGYEIFTSASIGAVLDLSGYASAEEVLRDADIAMYRAKTLGKSRIEIFNLELREQAMKRLTLENEIRRALNNSEFELYYQPIYSLITNQVTGFEALIRWNHPTRGMLLPNEFLPVAEETGLILPIGNWVLYQACLQINLWRQAFACFRDLTMNVNISGKQFKQQDFVDQIVQTLEETRTPASALRLEITESMVIENPAVANEYFTQLSNLGIQLQVDDFGTGYSSLSYLQIFPIQAIKIDRSFISNVGKPGKNSELVRTMLRMVHDLGMDAVAEGIENETQLEELKRLTCQFGQGFLLAKPMAKDQAYEVLQQASIIQVSI